jgi:hypothetical protein
MVFLSLSTGHISGERLQILIVINEIHLLAKDKNIHIHRQIDEFGKEIKRRKGEPGELL